MFDWLQNLADWLVHGIFGLGESSRMGIALNFFLYDTIKILILLMLITTLMGLVNAYFPVERLRDFLNRRKLYGLENLFASFFGAITPFCSCSSVPLFIGFVQGGIPLGVTFSFLITSPLVNEIALAMFVGLFGLKFTLIYALSGILLGTVGGMILGRMNLEKYLSEWVQNLIKAKTKGSSDYQAENISFTQRLQLVFKEAWGIVKSILIYVVIGIGIGAAMHRYVPENFFQQYLGSGQWWTVPLAVILAVPLYSNAAGIIPVIQVLVAKGVPIGTAIAFMMATIGLSIPEGTLLKKVMTSRLIGIYFGVVTLFIIISGFIFNLLL
ncbi:MAG: putative permease [Algoriphagus marincola HL-49]|uniref:Putative permease n=1 Tax=Algoriphagus marincola HL-49 TaxID=1305737 RepID=A0A0P7YEG2_9BACT|nr:MAG: putative permease [Algoriphagus marincola HL-49]